MTSRVHEAVDPGAPPRRSRLVASTPFYYGWVIVAVGTVGGVMTNPGQTPGISAFLDHFIADLDLSRGLVSSLYTAATLAASFVLPFVGRRFDRHGSRRMICLVSLLLGLACVYMSLVRNAVMLFVGFFLLRQLGQGSLSLVSRNVINLWWVRRRGRVMGLVGVAGALLSGLFPLAANSLIDAWGWRWTYVVFAAVLVGAMVPLGWLLVRDRPEDHGLQPDGAPASAADVDAPVEVNWSLAQAMRCTAFWVTCAGMCSMSMLNTGLYFHIFSVFADVGLSSATAAKVFVPIAGTAAAVQLITGWLVGRVHLRLLLAAALFLEAAVLVFVTRLSTAPQAYAFGVAMGVQGGIEMLVMSVIFASYFGRRHLGVIAGFSSQLLVAASALGPMPFGIARDLLGGYGAVLTAFAVLPFVLGVACVLFGAPPARPPEGR